MTHPTLTAAAVVRRLHDHASERELDNVRKRLTQDEPAIGLRMKDLFDVAKAATDLPLDELKRLLAEPTYEARMAAFCILDFKARKDLGSPTLCEVYVGHHDRITTWDMVDRAAPRVVGAAVVDGPYDVLHELASSPDPLRRRTAITAPLYFVRAAGDADLAEGFALAERLHADPEPVVHNAVGIFLKHAGQRDRAALRRFLDSHARAMPRPALRLAIEKLPPEVRRDHLAR